MPTVTRSRKERSVDGTHYHIAGVCSELGYSTRQQVVVGLHRGESWRTYGGGQYATIKKLSYCPASGCYFGPYITTRPDHTQANNLDNLPDC
jgi:hypothetical protein